MRRISAPDDPWEWYDGSKSLKMPFLVTKRKHTNHTENGLGS